MTNVHRGIIILIVFALIGWGIYEMRKPWTYSAKAFSGRVVDADTGEPLAGVNIAAFWILRRGRERVGYMEIGETVTDDQGRYAFPAWGPKWRPFVGYLYGEPYSDLYVIAFKRGYRNWGKWNEGKQADQPIREVSWDGGTIALQKFLGDLKAFDRHLMFITGFIKDVAGKSDCSWVKIEGLLQELFELRKEFQNLYEDYSFLPAKRNIYYFEQCKDKSTVNWKELE